MLSMRRILLSSLLVFSSASFAAGDIMKSEYTVKSGDALISILNKNKVDKEDIHNLIYNTKGIKNVQNLRVGQDLVIYKRPNGELEKIIFEMDSRNVFVASNEGDKFTLKKGMYKLDVINRYKVGTITYNLNKTLSEMGLTNAQKDQFKEMFKDQLDLDKIYKGAKIVAVFEEYYKGKEKQYTGNLIAGEVSHKNMSTKQAFVFKDSKGNHGYFAKNGQPLLEGFDVSPVKDYKRISSKFKPKRKHPVLGYVRAHKGVDYAAKPGTPIFASADGKVAMKDYQRKGYGHVLVINHADGYSTLYGHMKKVKKGVYAGKKVKKGEVIGYVGSTGLSTGPHLHFELRKNGKHLDPLKTDLPSGAKLAKKDVDNFRMFVKRQNDGFKIARMLNEKEGKKSVAIRIKRAE